MIAEGEVASAVLHDDDALVRLTLADATTVEASYPAAYSDELPSSGRAADDVLKRANRKTASDARHQGGCAPASDGAAW